MLNVQQISDRLEIQDTMTAYCRCIDTQDWDSYPSLFTEDARIDYTATGGGSGNIGEVLDFLGKAFSMVSACQHMVSNFEFELGDETANVRCLLHNPMVFGEPPKAQTHLFGVWYVLVFEKRAGRWLISSLEQELGYSVGPIPKPSRS